MRRILGEFDRCFRDRGVRWTIRACGGSGKPAIIEAASD
jgi:hypothetical protein